MDLPPETRERLHGLYRSRVDSYPGVDAAYGQRWRAWCRKLLTFGGALVVPPGSPESDLDALLADGSAVDARVEFVAGEPGECHHNVAALWIDGAIASIGTGYALSGDGLWRQHSWGLTRDGVLVETTDDRVGYVGITLPARARTMQFAGSNAQEHLKTALRRRDDRSAELVLMIRELAGARARPA
ncbi:hypothetical protein Q0Z83_021190 [Actinoplanes sichuanensis]|uniref:Uncharacterized protein n=1 Tax=Actinoplanes sichuanensis TaxID=512349 RepID=A0ABW4AK56_9ACTN|nr:hypothetical protein [Actinoplanes sichuanensis]BEL03928.1 hypothetical protein Q0Z83_021190 [Actinoplanes sichuanensis]